MIQFKLNGEYIYYSENEEVSLLKFLRETKKITSVKDGCSGEGTCGACLVEINGKAKLACTTKMKNLADAEVLSMEGFPAKVKETIAKAFVNKGAVQCGFCTPGFIARTKILLQENPNPTREEVQKAIKLNLCRCTGYKKIEDSILLAAKVLRNGEELELIKTSGKIGEPEPKYQAVETALGKRNFVNDIYIDGMYFSALKFSDYPRAKVLKINTQEASKLEGVVRIFTAKDVPAKRNIGLIIDDWQLMIAEGEITHYIGDVLAGVVAENQEIARIAAALIQVEYEILEAVTDVFDALKPTSIQVHSQRPNNFENSIIKIGNAEEEFAKSAFVVSGKFETQRIEHAFMEFEAAIALPEQEGIKLISQSQGIYEDRRQVALILGLPEEKVHVQLVPNGGGFGGKEDMTVQGHVSLYAFLLQKPVKLTLTRQESIRMHPKRHPVFMDMTLAANKNGKLTALKLKAIGDTGAYASVGMKVLERVAGHATGGYQVPCVDIEAKTVYTNNIPSGAMRGFGANQVNFALESLIDEICEKGNFNRWQFRYDNALVDGAKTSTGQEVFGVGIRACLLKLKDKFESAKYAGIATAIKNSGVGNGMADFSNVKIEIKSPQKVILHHGWTEMGQGVHNMALQTLCQETDLLPEMIEVVVDTDAQIKTGMTTSSRATALVGNAIIDASKAFKHDLDTFGIEKLVGKTYKGGWICDWTTKPGAKVEKPITHYSYGYAAQLCVLNENGEIEKIYAAHDAGKIMNPVLFEGQIEGAVHMGIGYALTEDLPMENGFLVSDKMRNLGILRADKTPEIEVIGVEVKDLVGPYGAKGIGEIGLVPTAGAIANALYQFDGIRRYKLPMQRKK